MPDNENQNQNDEGGESPNVKRMREQIETLQQREQDLLGRVRLSAFKEAGIDPEDGGMNKAIYQVYDGDPDPESIQEFAESEYDWEPPNPGPSEAQNRMKQVNEAGEAPDPENTLEKADKAAADGDWVKSGALKDQELLAVTQKRFG